MYILYTINFLVIEIYVKIQIDSLVDHELNEKNEYKIEQINRKNKLK